MATKKTTRKKTEPKGRPKYEPQWVSQWRESKTAYDNDTKDECYLVMQSEGFYDVWLCISHEMMETYFVIVRKLGHNITCTSVPDVVRMLKACGYEQIQYEVRLPEEIDYLDTLFPWRRFEVRKEGEKV